MLHAGDVLAGRYRLRERVGGGGMGDVWRGEDTVLCRTIAVKVLLAKLCDDRNFRERFRREARAIAALEGPGIVDVYDYGEETFPEGTVAFLVMQFVDGMSLSRRLAGWGRLNTHDTLRIVAQVGDALDIAHRAGIVHRDIKPGNILVRDDGRVVLVDFGIARTETNHTMTTTGVVLGTVTYMSPEQASGEKSGPPSDIYSLGVVAHQCLAGHPPFKADTPLGVLSAHLREVPPSLPGDVPQPVPELVSRAMSKDPGERWKTAARFAEACRAMVEEPPTPEPAESPDPAETVVPRVRQPAPAAAAPVPVTGARLPEIHFDAPRRPGAPPPPASAKPGKSRKRWRYALFIVTLVAALLGAVTLTWQPWEPTVSTGGSPAGHASEAAGRSDGLASDAPGGHDEPDSQKSSEKEKQSRSSGERQSGTPSETSPSATTSPEPATVMVPNVIGKSEGQARMAVTESDLRPAVIYEGEGDRTCSVTTQNPAAGRQAERKTTVTMTVRKAKDTCEDKLSSALFKWGDLREPRRRPRVWVRPARRRPA